MAKAYVLSNDYSHYEELKATYPESERPAALSDLLTEMEQARHLPFGYVQILVDENLQDKLMDYCQSHPEEILSLYKHLDQRFVAQMNDLFLQVLRAHARNASKRGAYQHVGQQLKAYAKACGKEKANLLRQELLRTYPRKPAFLEELNMLRF